MYVTTFYSFKGGVGRTMALVNVAVELARRGRRVLAVDFDLEAPGLDTFDILRPTAKVPGIIDFVGEYLLSGQAPKADRFISKATGVNGQSGGLWIMPSGAQQATYAANFSRIDWSTLYEQHDGYLLFEDLKAQWRQNLKPDYVLIDSRTGHTDTGGICTRQLPDAVAILFFPNEQNLRGLAKVVPDIRSEARGPRRKEIRLHFVMSNVPDLDDEDRILEGKIDAFRSKLDFGPGPLVVHRYDSLSLLNQVVFTQDRPRSRLAKEYCELVREIARSNTADRDGALDYIRQTSGLWRRHGTPDEFLRMDERLAEIERLHAQDGEVLFALGALREDYRRPEAAALFERAIAAGYDEPRAYLRRARLRSRGGDLQGAAQDAARVLQSRDVPAPLVREAILFVPSDPHKVAGSPAVTSLDPGEQIWLASGLESSPAELDIAVSILEPLAASTRAVKTRPWARSILAMRRIGIGQCSAAAELLRLGGRSIADMDAQDAFNYGMATWGDTGQIVAEAFTRVVELDRDDSPGADSNYLQCMAVACWAVGDAAAAREFEHRSRETLEASRGPAFSCWQYRKVPAPDFLKDLDEIKALIGGDTSRRPQFVTVTAPPE